MGRKRVYIVIHDIGEKGGYGGGIEWDGVGGRGGICIDRGGKKTNRAGR